MFIKIRHASLFIVLAAAVLSGCKQQTPIETIYEVLERAAVAEEIFAEQQEPLVELEKQEQHIYEQIIAAGMKEKEQVAKLADEAGSKAAQRKKHMDLESKSLAESKNKFQSLPPLIQEIRDPNLKEISEKLYQTMMERYDIHDEISKSYNEALQLDQGLYAMLKEEDPRFEEIEEQVSEINKAYEKVLEANRNFNEKTKEYNETKLFLYKESGIDIKMDEG